MPIKSEITTENYCWFLNLTLGSSVGALIAALVCIHSDEELPLIFEKGGIDLNAFSTKSKDGNLQRKFKRLLKYGYLLDIKVLEDCVKSNVGNYTFQEAFNKTGRVLNIVVSSSRKNEIPNVLNYITAPTVLIWSACCASVAVFGLYKSIDLLAKDSNGDIYPFNSSEINWGEAVNDNDNAEHRLSELFGVNHFIISQASQVLAPLISLMIGGKSHGEDISAKVGNLVSNEIRHRIKQLAYLGLVPNQIQRLFVSGMKINSNSNIKIEPHIYLNDARDVFSNPTAASLDYWILKGQQSTFPFVENIKCRMMIEIAIEDILARVTALGGVKEKEEPEVVDIRRNMSYNGRSSSFHVQI